MEAQIAAHEYKTSGELLLMRVHYGASARITVMWGLAGCKLDFIVKTLNCLTQRVCRDGGGRRRVGFLLRQITIWIFCLKQTKVGGEKRWVFLGCVRGRQTGARGLSCKTQCRASGWRKEKKRKREEKKAAELKCESVCCRLGSLTVGELVFVICQLKYGSQDKGT